MEVLQKRSHKHPGSEWDPRWWTSDTECQTTLWLANVAELQVDGWQPIKDAVVMQSQRLAPATWSSTIMTLTHI